MTPTGVIRTYYAIAGLYTLAASMIWGVNTLFLLHAGLDLFEVFVANSAYAVGTVVFEVPTGVVADTLGRRVSFLASAAILVATTLGYVALERVGAGLWAYCAVSFLIGLGFTFYSGAVEAWLVDALTATGSTDRLDAVFARSGVVTGIAMLTGAVGGGALGTVDLAGPYLARALLLAVVFVVAARGMWDLGFTPRPVGVRELGPALTALARDSATLAWRMPALRLLLLIGFLQEGFLLWAWYAWQPWFLALLGRPDAVWVAGTISAGMAIAMIVGNLLVERLSRYCGRRTTLIAWALALQAGGAIALGLTSSFPVAVALFVGMIGTNGVYRPVRSAFLHALVPSAQRASVLSFGSLVGSAGGAAGGLGLGWVARAWTIPGGYLLGGVVVAATLPLVGLLRGRRDFADVIVGSAGSRAACAAHGVPDVGGVAVATVDPVPPSPAA